MTSAWLRLRSVRVRLAVLYSVILLAASVLLVAAINLAISRSLAGEPVAQTFQITAVSRAPGIVVVEERTVRGELLDLEEVVNERTLASLRRFSLLGLAGLFPLSLVIGWLVSGRVLRPIGRIGSVARDIQTTDLSRRIELEGPEDELKNLADTFDAMLDRIENSVADRQAFVEDASHELRNPLAVMATSLDVVLADPDSDRAEYRRTAEVVRRTIDRTVHTVDDLVRYARRQVPAAQREPVDLARLVIDTGAEYAGAASARNLALVNVSSGGARVEVDRASLRRALGNLLDNAVRLAPAGSCIRIGAGATHDWAWVGVADEGPGIPADRHGTVFDRSWSTRRAPQRGLGLAIVRQVAESHGGLVTLRSREGMGSSFVVWLPAAPGAERSSVTADGLHPLNDPLGG